MLTGRICRIVLLATALSLALAAGDALPRARAGDEQLAKLILDLGSENWGRRESAQSRILETGLPLAALLEKAARSGNLELAYRAKYLLSRIDPSIMQCQVIQVDLDPAPRITSAASGSGEEGDDLTVRPVALGAGRKASGAATGSSYTEDSTFSIRFRGVPSPQRSSGRRTLSAGAVPETPGHAAEEKNGAGEEIMRFEVTAAQLGAGSSRAELKTRVIAPDSTSILRTGERCLERRLGLQIERERHRFVTLLRLRAGRRSLVGELAPPASPQGALDSLVDQLLVQGKSQDPDVRSEAVEILGLLRAKKAAGLFRETLSQGPDWPLAALGLDEPGLLRTIIGVRDSGGLGAEPVPEEASLELQTRAAARLVEMGDERGLDVLLARLVDADPTQLHSVVAALADYCQAGAASAQGRKRVLDAVFSDEFFSHAVWEDVETEYLLSAATRLLRPEAESDKALLEAGMERLTRLARGELGPINVRMRICIDAWRRLAVKRTGKPSGDGLFLLEALPFLKGASSIMDAVTLLETALNDGSFESEGTLPGRMSDADLMRLLNGLLIHIREGEPMLAGTCCQALVRISRAITVGPGQLRRVVSASVEAGEALLEAQAQAPLDPQQGVGSASAALRSLEEQLAKWTGLPPVKHAAGARPFSSDEWKAWLQDEKLVEARENALEAAANKPPDSQQAGGDLPGHLEAPRELVFYEFEILLSGGATAGTRQDDVSSPRFHIIDGCRIDVSPSRPVACEDRWGNRRVIRIESDGSPARGQPQRFRVNSKIFLFLGLPLLTTQQTRELSLTWHETSDSFLGSRILPGGGSSGYRSLYFLDYRDQDPPSAPTAGDSDQLWAWFLDNRLLKLPPDAAQDQLKGRLGIFRTLGIKECAPLLREVLKVKPTLEVALQLLEIGDESGAAFLRSEIASGDSLVRFKAALALCQAGLPEGIDALIDLSQKSAAMMKTQGYSVTASLRGFLERVREPDPARNKALGFLLEHIDESTFQAQGFAILSREAGIDFGFEATRGQKDPQEHTLAIQAAVRAAREWWEQRKSKTK